MRSIKAIDKDSQPSITYTIRQGDTDKFQIDPKSGVVRTRRPLDYERQNQYVLIVATTENNDAGDPQASAVVVVDVLVHKRPNFCFYINDPDDSMNSVLQDRNDVAPVFPTAPRPVRLSSTVPVGHVVTGVAAVDSDGSPPNNLVNTAITVSTMKQT